MSPRPALLLLSACAALALTSCAVSPSKPAAATQARGDAPEPDQGEDITTGMSGVRYATVREAFLTASTPQENVDSPASWQSPDGRILLLATAKGTDRLLRYDGETGASLEPIGTEGDAPGEFRRPNGMFVIDDLAFVVERDNRRVQVLRLPGLTSLGHFGAEQLEKPYGLWVRRQAGGYEVLVSDAYMDPQDEDRVPPLSELGRRFQRYRVQVGASAVDAVPGGSFGDTTSAGAIRVPESLWGDAARNRLLLAEEDQTLGTRLRQYDFAFRYTGRDLGVGVFRAQAEGLALWSCADGSGYWIATDQYKDRSVFHLFDRASLDHLGAFAGEITANTDGVWLEQSPSRTFPAGVFYAVHDDQGVAAFDWRDVASALGLRQDCD